MRTFFVYKKCTFVNSRLPRMCILFLRFFYGMLPIMSRALIPLLLLTFVHFVSCDSDRPANWGFIYETIVSPNCTTVSCHSRVNGQSGVRLESSTTAYSILAGRACETIEGVEPDPSIRNFVFPGDPERSELIHLLRGQNVQRSMPPDRLLPNSDIQLIEQWILEGALCN